MGLITDTDNVTPTLEFSYRKILAEGMILALSNTPKLQNNSFMNKLETYPWSEVSSEVPMSYMPINLNIALEVMKPKPNTDKSFRFILSNHSKFQYNAPIPLSSLNYGVAKFYYTDKLHNTSSATLLYNSGSAVIRQEVGVNLAYLVEENYDTEPYTPLVTVITDLMMPFDPLDVSLRFTQDYHTHDHHGSNLSEGFSLDIEIAYRHKNSNCYLRLANLLDSTNRLFSEYPNSGRALVLGIAQRF